MNLALIKKILLILVVAITVITKQLIAQGSFNSSDELKQTADEYFQNEQFIDAFPLYSQLLSLDRDNYELRYKFGVCLLFADRRDTYEPIRYLKYALKHISTPDIYYYLGFAHHINYDFPTAISYYKEYQVKAGKKKKDAFDVDRKIEMCQNGMNMLRSVKDLFVLEKFEVSRDEFFRSYNLEKYGGKIIKKPEGFLSKDDKRYNVNDFIFFNSKANSVYYSAYSKDYNSQRDLYVRTKIEEGWSEPEKLSSVINTPYDEDYPVLMPDGRTLYFSSKGHNTMGGYDIFKTVYNEYTETWSNPENINFPFNTPTDDILFIPDTVETAAWFASVRNTTNDKIMVYQVGIVKRPGGSEDLAEIFAKNKELSEDDLRNIKNRARLDVNISEQEFEDTPNIDKDIIANAQAEHKENLNEISADIEKKKKQQAIIDSAKLLVDKFDRNIEAFDSLNQKARSTASSKRLEANRIKDQIKTNLEIASSGSNIEGMKKAVKFANIDLNRAEKLEYEATELMSFANKTKEQADKQKATFVDINSRYGDAEQAVISENSDRAFAIIEGMNQIIDEMPDIGDLDSPFTEDENILNIQYPIVLNKNNFQAFAINTRESTPQIESFDSRYDKFIPKEKKQKITEIESNYSNIPFDRLQGYINTLNDKSKSIDIQISEVKNQISDIKENFDLLSNDDKQNKTEILNQLEEEKSELNAEKDWISSQVDKKQNKLKNIYASSADSTERSLQLQKLNVELESFFDFDKKIFTPDAFLPNREAITFYSIDKQGLLVAETSKPELITSTDIDFSIENKNFIESQATQMLAETRILFKKNQFLLRKIESKTENLRINVNESFIEANDLLSNAKEASAGNKKPILDQANKKFREVAKLNSEYSSYQKNQNQLSESIDSQEDLITKLESEHENIKNALKQQNFTEVEGIYKNMENIFRNNQEKGDFSTDIDYEKGEVLSIEENGFKEDVYQLNNLGEITKTIGDPNIEWNSFESFSKEINNPVQSDLVLSPNTNLQIRQTQYTDIFEPQQPENATSIPQIDVQIPEKLSSSQNSLVENSIDQINSLKSKLNELIRKRNTVNQYYKDQLAKSSDKEKVSLELLNKNNITTDILNEANQSARESKEELYRASTAASLIRQYDEQISTYSSLISNSLQTASEVQEMVAKGDQDEALLKNVQLQRKISNADSQKMKDSNFSFSTNEIIVDIPEKISSVENQEFIIVDGQIQRNNQAQINQLFYEESYPVKVDAFENLESLTSSENMIAATTSDKTESITSDSQNQSFDKNSELDSEGRTNNSFVSLKSYNPTSFTKAEDFRQALSELNTYGQEHISNLNAKSASLAALAEQKLNKSNDLNIRSEKEAADSKQVLRDSAKIYLYEALAIKEVAESLDDYINQEQNKQEQITQATFEIEQKLNNDNLSSARQDFQNLKTQVVDFGSNSTDVLTDITSQMNDNIEDVNRKMDSAYNYSQKLANESVKLLSEAKEEREKAEGKRNAFKRREYLKQAEEKEIEATRLQNDSEKALAAGNQFYQRKTILNAIEGVNSEIDDLTSKTVSSQSFVNSQDVVFDNLDSRKSEIFEGQFNTTDYVESENQSLNNRPVGTDDIHVYQRENFKAEMISDELDLLKREIALLVQSQNQSLSEKESYIVSKKIDLLRQKADSLEYEANKAFEYANLVLKTLSDKDREKAQEAGRDFDSYLSKLKGKIEFLLSEAASLKQRAQRSNNIETREDLFNQVKDKEEVAMYLILEEFEVIAQKNKTRYRRNQLILEQLLMENASPEERELMRNIFAQIDNYFSEAAQKRKKANEPGTSFSLKKILLQDAYSLEMKGLDLQQKAKSMIENNDRNSMLAYQEDGEPDTPSQEDVIPEERSIVTENQLADNETNETVVNRNQTNTVIQIPFNEEGEEGIYYKVQFSALKEIKNINDFPRISEITAERVSGTEFIRYFSGKFDNIDNAIIRRNSIRASGYSDAFIKSWRNGEEVNLLSLNSNQINTASEPTPSFTTETSINNIDFSATNITSLQGVYYTVQVGVYSRPRTSAMIYGISPLYHKRMNNGYWIYYSGIFKSIAAAENKKEEIRQKGVDDAFVVAFSNGDQINLAEARQQISRGEETPSDDAIVILEDASIQLNRQWNLNQSNTTITSTDESSNELIYKVQVGVYSNPINLNWISTQLDNNNPVERYQNSNGKYVFTVGNFRSQKDARELLKQVSEIVSDAFIVGFQNGQKKYIR